MAGKAVKVRLKLDGVTRDTVDTLQALQLAQDALRLAIKVAEAGNASFTLHGLHVGPGSVVLVATPSDASAAKLGMTRAMHIVEGMEDPPHGVELLVNQVRDQLRRLPPSQSAKYMVGGWSGRLAAPPVASKERPWERINLRAIPIRVGGASDHPRAWLASPSERFPFVVDVARDDARTLGKNLYGEVDIRADVVRDADGRIEQGKIIEVFELADDEPIAAWRAWFADNAADWDHVGDVMDELGRGHD